MSSHTVTANILLTQQIQMPCEGASWDEIKDSEAFPKKSGFCLIHEEEEDKTLGLSCSSTLRKRDRKSDREKWKVTIP